MLALIMSPPLAAAGSLKGVVKINAKLPELPRARGFVKRVPNPIMALKSANPRPEIIVVLMPTDGVSMPPAKQTRYELRDESFVTPYTAVKVGGTVEIKNIGKTSPILFAEGLEPAVLDPRNKRAISSVKEGVTEIRAQKNPHLVGRVVGVPSSVFALVDARGNYTIGEVPDGKWKVRVWYRDGWLKTERVVNVRNRTTLDLAVENLTTTK